MLWINIIMDTLGGLAFSGEAAVKEIMKEKPKKRSEGLLSRYMIGHIIFSGMFTVAICLNFLCSDKIRAFYGASENPVKHLGAFFGLFIFLGIFNCFTARTERINLGAHISKNKMFLVIMASVALIQTFMIYFGGSLFRTLPLSFTEMAFVIALAFLIIPADFLHKVFLRVKKSKRK
jgi:magnesium-transporting ATPase (P-type)